MRQTLVKVGLIGLAAIASVGVIVASANTVRRMGLLSRAGAEYGPIEPPTVEAGDTTSTIRWQTQSPVVSVVNYGTSETDLSIPAFEANQTTDHQVVLTGLLADQTYYYEIVAGEETFRKNGGPYSFRTLPAVNPKPTYPPCEIGQFKALYGSSTGEANFNSTYDINGDGVINSIDYFECIKVNPPE